MSMLHHRGPDGSGYYRDHTVCLGHTRLAIIDPTSGVQPMANEDETVWVTFNGEIYNYVELTEQLRDRGHTFRTASDTEVIVHAWEEWGDRCFSHFNGQWALAIWDLRARRLVLSRDRFGERPLFYTRVDGRFLFASEVKSLFADPGVAREFDPEGLAQVLSLWSAVAPRTVFAGIKQVPPGCFLTLDGSGESCRRYWEPEFVLAGGGLRDRSANISELRRLLIESTRLRFLRSDVPVGAYLSGGIDSAVTAAVIAEFTRAQLRTFSLRFTDQEFDEGPFQRLMVDRLGTDHHEVEVTGTDIAAAFPDVVWHAETPFLRSGPAPMFLLSQLVRNEGYKVVVTGEGADEVLAGYDLFREAKVRLFWARDPASPMRARAIELLYPWLQRTPNKAPAFARAFFGRNLDPADPAVSHRPRWDSTGVLRTMLTPEFSSESSPEAAALSALPAASSSWSPLALAQWLEMQTLLPGYLLSSQGDRMLMANSVEGRFPFLDNEFVEFAGRVPADQKLPGLQEKQLLKQAFADLVPVEILRRPKQPYRAPDAASFFVGAEPDWLADVLTGDAIRHSSVFQPAVVTRLLEKCRVAKGRGIGNTDNMRLLAVATVQLLYRLFISAPLRDGRAAAEPPQPMAVFDYVHHEGVR